MSGNEPVTVRAVRVVSNGVLFRIEYTWSDQPSDGWRDWHTHGDAHETVDAAKAAACLLFDRRGREWKEIYRLDPGVA